MLEFYDFFSLICIVILIILAVNIQKAALDWCFDIEKSVVMSLSSHGLYMVPLLFNLDREFLSIKASSASCERRFGDAGHNENYLRKNIQDSMSQMLLMIRSFNTISYSELNSEKRLLICFN